MRDRPFQLMLVDEDPVFRLGLRIWLEQFVDFVVVAEASTGGEALETLRRHQSANSPSTESSETPGTASEAIAEGAASEPPQAMTDQPEARQSPTTTPVATAALKIDLVIIDIGLGQQDSSQILGLQLCQQMRVEFPPLPLLVLSTEVAPVLREAALSAGATAFGARGMPVAQLVQLVRQTIAQSMGALPTQSLDPAAAVASAQSPGLWTALRRQMRQVGVQQIDTVINAVNAELETNLSLFAWIVLTGRRRELRAARWLTQRLLATPDPRSGREAGEETVEEAGGHESLAIDSASPTLMPVSGSIAGPASRGVDGRLVTNPSAVLNAGPSDIQALVFDAVFRKLQHSLENPTAIPLEIDILRTDKKRELLYVTLRQLEAQLNELRHSQVQPGQLNDQTLGVLVDLWQAVTNDFFGKYYTLQLDGIEQAVVKTLLADAAIVEQTMLSRIPLVPSLLGHLLFAEPLAVDGALQAATSYEALIHSQRLLENLLIQVACSVLQPLLNHFADVEAFKKRFYNRQVMSTREIERFRNNLSWRYRWDDAVYHPKAIFESQYRLLTLSDQGVNTCYIYAPRRQELETLSGLQYGLTLALEARDAIAPRLQTLIALLGNGIVYVLTEVVGRGIGLVGRGILQGIGNAWQESRPNREKRQ
ncbi:MAG: DUF3685 domain-containing protein [Cyanobacteria bacterium P01_A01_bin.123]